MPGFLVHKYGGTSVGSPERIQAVADRIARAYQTDGKLVVVVSAMGHTTDDLISLAHRVSKTPPHREMDMLLTAGERISMALLSMALADRKVPALSFTGSQTGIITTGSHRRARIRHILGDRVRAALTDGKVAIVAGFQGVSENKEITTLGRGGSDTTAVALAAALGADACEIYTDVDGVFSADPRVVPGARLLRQIGHDQMVELATRGAGVLHPRSVELAKQFGVKLRVRSSLRSIDDHSYFTEIGEPKKMEDFRVLGVTSDQSKMLVDIELERPGALAAVWNVAAQHSLAVISPFFMDQRVRFFGDIEALDEWKTYLSELAVQGFVKSYELDDSRIPLSVVGDRFSQDGTVLQKVMEILAENHILVTMGAASALAITVAVSKNHADDGVRVLHEALVSKW
ncbi:MAG: aspartate kinase [Oligoflexia bacterium]|nr:aspartate kinase [Oligoflexia bacterium]